MRLIDADELRKEINKQAYPYKDSTANDIYFSTLHLLANAPTVELVQHEKRVDDLIPNKKYVPELWSAYDDYAFERGWNACVDTVKERINELR